jgi:hypothetical protein
MIRRITRKVLRLVWRRSPTLRTHSPLTSNSPATSFRNGASSCRAYSGSATRRRCATRNLSARTAVRKAITRATKLESPFRRPLTTPRTRSAADSALMRPNSISIAVIIVEKRGRSRNCHLRHLHRNSFKRLGFSRRPASSEVCSLSMSHSANCGNKKGSRSARRADRKAGRGLLNILCACGSSATSDAEVLAIIFAQ